MSPKSFWYDMIGYLNFLFTKPLTCKERKTTKTQNLSIHHIVQLYIQTFGIFKTSNVDF
jgi:hypothetical protein